MAASTQDFAKTIDLTAESSISASQINQLLETGTPHTDKGLNVTTTDTAGVPDVPDAATTTKWQTYLWRRVKSDGVIVYKWNPALTSDATFLKWEEVSSFTSPTTTRILQFATMAELKAYASSELVDGAVVNVLGYYSSTGMGGGIFIWDSDNTQSEDDGYYVLPDDLISGVDPGRWVRQFAGAYPNVRMWGAKGDDTQDDTAYIAAAMNAVKSVSAVNKRMHFPRGVYKVSSTIEIPTSSYLSGEGYNTVVKMDDGTEQNVLVSTIAARALLGGIITSGGEYYAAGQAGDPNYYLDWDHKIRIEYLAINGGNNSTNACLILARPGETALLTSVQCNNGGYGLRVLGMGAPGLCAVACSNHSNKISAFRFEPIVLANNSEVDYLAAIYLEHCSADGTDGVTEAAFDFWHVLPVVNIDNMKIETAFSRGVVSITPPNKTLSTHFHSRAGNTFRIKGGTVNNGATANDLVRINLNAAGQELSPVVIIDNVNVYDTNNAPILIRDKHNPNEDGTDYVLEGEDRSLTGSGLHQLQAINAITYIAGLHTSTIKAKRQIITDNFSYNVFKPASEGWYRIANSVSNFATGRFSVKSYNQFVQFIVQRGSNRTDITIEQDTVNTTIGTERVRAFFDTTKGVWALEIYVVPNGTANRNNFYVGYEINKQNSFSELGILVAPYLNGTTVIPTPSNYYVEIEVNKNSSTGGNFNEKHAVLGNLHLWVDSNRVLRVFDSEVLLKFSGTGTGAAAVAYIADGSIVATKITSGGSGYDASNTTVQAIPVEEYTPTLSATIIPTITSGAVTALTISNGGTGYKARPDSEFFGRALIPLRSDDSITIPETSQQTLVAATREFSIQQVTLSVVAGSKEATLASATNLPYVVRQGDMLQEIGGNNYRIESVFSPTRLRFKTAYAGTTGNKVFQIVGWRLFDSKSASIYHFIAFNQWDITTGTAGLAISSSADTSIRLQFVREDTGGATVLGSGIGGGDITLNDDIERVSLVNSFLEIASMNAATGNYDVLVTGNRDRRFAATCLRAYYLQQL